MNEQGTADEEGEHREEPGESAEASAAELAEKLSDFSSTASLESLSILGGAPGDGEKAGGADADEDEAGGLSSVVLFEFGQSEAMRLRNPFSVALDPSNRILVLDQPDRDTFRVTRFDPAGEYLDTVFTCINGSGEKDLKHPQGIALGPRGNIYLPDAGNDRIQKFSSTGEWLCQIGRSGERPGEFSFPCDVDIDETGMVYVADTGNSRIQKLTAEGVFLRGYGVDADGYADIDQPELDEPVALTPDEEGNVFVGDTGHHRLVKFSAEGEIVLSFGEEGEGPGQFQEPSDVRVEAGGMIFVADQDNTRVQSFDGDGRFVRSFKLSPEAGRADGGGDVAVDDDGYLYICDLKKHVVAKVELIDPSLPAPGAEVAP